VSSTAAPARRQILHAAVRLDRSQLAVGTGARNALGVCLPLVVGAATGYRTEGIVMAGAALLVGFCDLGGPFASRARTLVAASIVAGVSTTVGTWTGNSDVLTVVLMGLWGFAAGLAIAFSRQTAFVALNASLALLIAADFPLPLDQALSKGAFALAGGLLQASLALVMWPLAPRRPERIALAAAYRSLAASLAGGGPTADEVVHAQQAIDTARASLLDAHGRAYLRSPSTDALRTLLDAADRLSVAFAGLADARRRIGAGPASDRAGPALASLLLVAGPLIEAVATGLESGRVPIDVEAARSELDSRAEKLRAAGAGDRDVQDALELLASARTALRGAVDVATAGRGGLARLWSQRRAAPGQRGAAGSGGGGRAAPRDRPRSRGGAGPTDDRAAPAVIAEWAARRRRPAPLAVLRANLTWRSLAMQHALRLGVTLALAVAVYRIGDLGRGYWVPLTVVFVLRPDFATTFTRGAQRYAGTALGIVLATALVALTDPGDAALIVLIFVFATGVYAFFYANYGLFTLSITALIVFLVSLGGVPELTAAVERGIDTAVGAALALVAWALWPTWESGRLPAALGDLLDADRAYLVIVLGAYGGGAVAPGEMERARDRALVARANAEESLQRVLAEPARHREGADAMAGVLAETERLALSVVAVEAHVPGREGDSGALADARAVRRAAADGALAALSADLDRALAGAAGAVRAGRVPPPLGDLRDRLAGLPADDPAMAGEAERIVAATEAIHGLLAPSAAS
jgi:uncharacterized membrane protein YccC